MQDLSVNPLAASMKKLERQKIDTWIRKAQEAVEDIMIANEEKKQREQYELYKVRKRQMEEVQAQKEADRLYEVRSQMYMRSLYGRR